METWPDEGERSSGVLASSGGLVGVSGLTGLGRRGPGVCGRGPGGLAGRCSLKSAEGGGCMNFLGVVLPNGETRFEEQQLRSRVPINKSCLTAPVADSPAGWCNQSIEMTTYLVN